MADANRNWRDFLQDWRLIVLSLTLVGTIGGWLSGGWTWVYDQHQVNQEARDQRVADLIIGVVTTRIDDLDDQVQSILLRQADLSYQVTELKEDPQIAEYDKLRSRITSDDRNCVLDGTTRCKYQFRVRLTTAGAECRTPSATRSRAWVVNHGGALHPVQLFTTFAQAEGDYRIFSGEFLPPSPQVARPGLSEFYIDLWYPGCPWAAEGMEVKERTHVLAFRLVDPEK